MKIYIVDDASFIRIICRYHIEKAGFEIVGEAYDGQQAIDARCKLQPDCVVVDLALPNKSGIEVMREVQKDFPHIQFLVISALDKDVLDRAGNDVEYASFLAKPFEGSELVERLVTIQDNQKALEHG